MLSRVGGTLLEGTAIESVSAAVVVVVDVVGGVSGCVVVDGGVVKTPGVVVDGVVVDGVVVVGCVVVVVVGGVVETPGVVVALDGSPADDTAVADRTANKVADANKPF